MVTHHVALFERFRTHPGRWRCRVDSAVLDGEALEAPYAAVMLRLALPGKARERGALAVAEFKKLAKLVWPPATEKAPRRETGGVFR